jgi:CheY-like chemotaxis protein
MGGMETFAVLRTLDDNVQAVIATAHAEDPVIEHYREMGFVKAVVKPFRLEQLAEALSEAVGR